jgi:hypothetical protein
MSLSQHGNCFSKGENRKRHICVNQNCAIAIALTSLFHLEGCYVPIPPLNERGYLPEGVHECTIEEIASAFGQTQGSDRRPRLLDDLQRYVRELVDANVAKYLIVDGSFVTSKSDPNDIDVLLVLRDDYGQNGVIPPYQYNVRSKSYVRAVYKLDFYYGFEGEESANDLLEVFTQVRNSPDERKGYLKVPL